jgi:hypothetical protein
MILQVAGQTITESELPEKIICNKFLELLSNYQLFKGKNLPCKHSIMITYKLYRNNLSDTIMFLLFSELSIHYDMFLPIWPPSGKTYRI